jgi:hypothetical protein
MIEMNNHCIYINVNENVNNNNNKGSFNFILFYLINLQLT